jgi:hypothetical protein
VLPRAEPPNRQEGKEILGRSTVAIAQKHSGASFVSLLVITELTVPNWAAMGDSEKTQDTQIDRKLGPDVLRAWVETHTLFASFLYYSLNLLCFLTLSLFFKALLLYNSLKPCF